MITNYSPKRSCMLCLVSRSHIFCRKVDTWQYFLQFPHYIFLYCWGINKTNNQYHNYKSHSTIKLHLKEQTKKRKNKQKQANKQTDVFKNSPPLVVVISKESVKKTECSNYCSKQQHLSIKTQPSKINANLFSVIFPVEEKYSKIVVMNPVAGLIWSKYATANSTCLWGLTW